MMFSYISAMTGSRNTNSTFTETSIMLRIAATVKSGNFVYEKHLV